jgi:hypothetical protein
MPLASPLRRHLRPSSSPEDSDHTEPYRASMMILSELSLPAKSHAASNHQIIKRPLYSCAQLVTVNCKSSRALTFENVSG